jgi:hypothetical protein
MCSVGTSLLVGQPRFQLGALHELSRGIQLHSGCFANDQDSSNASVVVGEHRVGRE